MTSTVIVGNIIILSLATLGLGYIAASLWKKYRRSFQKWLDNPMGR